MSLREHFERRAKELAGLATVEAAERDGAVTVRIRPKSVKSVGVTLYLLDDKVGTVALEDQACVPAELGDDEVMDRSAIDHFIEVAVTGRATAFHLGRGGCVEEHETDGKVRRTWMNAWPWPGWRRRAKRIEYTPYA